MVWLIPAAGLGSGALRFCAIAGEQTTATARDEANVRIDLRMCGIEHRFAVRCSKFAVNGSSLPPAVSGGVQASSPVFVLALRSREMQWSAADACNDHELDHEADLDAAATPARR